MGEAGLIDLEQRSDGVSALEVAAEADEVPALAVNHGGVGDAFEEVDGVNEGREDVVDVGAELAFPCAASASGDRAD